MDVWRICHKYNNKYDRVPNPTKKPFTLPCSLCSLFGPFAAPSHPIPYYSWWAWGKEDWTIIMAALWGLILIVHMIGVLIERHYLTSLYTYKLFKNIWKNVFKWKYIASSSWSPQPAGAFPINIIVQYITSWCTVLSFEALWSS